MVAYTFIKPCTVLKKKNIYSCISISVHRFITFYVFLVKTVYTGHACGINKNNNNNNNNNNNKWILFICSTFKNICSVHLKHSFLLLISFQKILYFLVF